MHLLARMPATLVVSDFVKHLKGSSAHLATHDIAPGEFFKWQGGYAAFSVGLDQLGTLRAYIRHQKEHHALDTLIQDWEEDTDDSACPNDIPS